MSLSSTAPLAPLTTIFTPPCPTTWLITTSKDPSQFPSFPTAGATSCDPPAWSVNIESKGFQYYSPAICPSGFEVGANCGITTTRTTEGFPAVKSGETAVYCVPSGQTCTTDLTDYRGGVWGATGNGDTFTVGPAIQIRFQQSDLSSLETHPLTPGLTLSALGSTATLTTSIDGSSSTIIMYAVPASSGSGTTLAAATSVPASMSQLSSAETSMAKNTHAIGIALIVIATLALVVGVAFCVFYLVQFRRYEPHVRDSHRQKCSHNLTMISLVAWLTRRHGHPQTSQGLNGHARKDSYELEGEVGLSPSTKSVPEGPLEATEKPPEAPEKPAELDAVGSFVPRISQYSSWVSRAFSPTARSSTAIPTFSPSK